MSEDSGSGSIPNRVLLIEEDPRTAMLIGEMLRAGLTQKLIITHASRFIEASQELRDHGATCVLLGLSGEGPESLSALEHLTGTNPNVPIIVLSNNTDSDFGLAAIKAGAQDYLRTPELNATALGRAVSYALERKRSEVELAHQALHDPLTELPNRALFGDRLSVALDRARRTGMPVAVLFLDVDGFKDVNDTLGHQAGDQLLSALAERFQEMLRPMDTVARFGGDEFTFLFEELESEREAILIADRIRSTASLPMTLGNDGESTVAVSIGIAIVTDPSVAPESVIRDADVAMYRAKELGGDRFELYDETARVRASRRLELENALRRAVERSELRVHYQPRVSLSGETDLTGFEALVRWEHPERGLIPAQDFVALAEETGLIVPIGEWVLGEALAHIAGWRESRPGVTISVNLSARQLAHPGLAAQMDAAVRAIGAEPGVLCLEVTEDAVERNHELATRSLEELSAVGVRLALDDFGTGHSSVAGLRDMPLNSVNIDRSFVSGLGVDPGSSAVVGALVELGHALGLNVVAEGVETAEQLARLRDLGCDGAQGYLFSRPLPVDGVHALLGPS